MTEAEKNEDLVMKIILKYREDREVIKQMRARHAQELEELETYQGRREAALIERADISAFGFMTDLFLNGRNDKAAVEKGKETIALNQTKIEGWLLKMLLKVGDGIKTEFGTVYKTRKESVACADFEMFVSENMVKPAVKELVDSLGVDFVAPGRSLSANEVAGLILNHLHLELLTKAVRKESVLEIMGDPAPDGSRPNKPPVGCNYVAVQTVGVRKK